MASSTAKRVIVYRFNRQPAEGYVSPAAYLGPDYVTLLTRAGSIDNVPYPDLKALCFASESSPADLFTAHTAFERRPRLPGLWVRLVFTDGDELEGVLPPNLLEMPPEGYLITPPKASAARQRVFAPRAALKAVDIRGATGVKRPSFEGKPLTADQRDKQLRMFEPDPAPKNPT